MNLLQDIKEILNHDKEHHLKIEVDSLSVRVYIDYDPLGEYEEKTIIPIEYAIAEELVYIPDDRYRELFNVNDFGIDINEIKLIKDIMEYLENHKNEIKELCHGYSWEERENKEDEKTN